MCGSIHFVTVQKNYGIPPAPVAVETKGKLFHFVAHGNRPEIEGRMKREREREM